jgi:arylformamidase
MSAIYRGMTRAQLDAAYDNSKGVANSSVLMADLDRRSAELRAAYPDYLNLAYGPAPRNRIDYFSSGRPGPLLIFIHGGYWQMRHKDTFSALAAGPLAHGIHVAMVGYTLAPEATLAQIVAECRRAVAWLGEHAPTFGGDAEHMIVSGWSAGGHLAAMCLDEPGVHSGLAISGIYDLEPVRMNYLNDKLRLTPADERSLSPLHLPLSSKPLVLAYGGAELPELQRQSEVFEAARAHLPGHIACVPGLNHFTILDEFVSPTGALTRKVRKLAALI